MALALRPRLSASAISSRYGSQALAVGLGAPDSAPKPGVTSLAGFGLGPGVGSWAGRGGALPAQDGRAPGEAAPECGEHDEVAVREPPRPARFGERAASRLVKLESAAPRERIRELNAVLYDEAGFEGDRLYYDDLRNSCLNAVVARRRGIPITLSIVYMDVAARAGIKARGVSFPGHFLRRVPGADHLLDPCGGRRLYPNDCRELLARQFGPHVALTAEHMRSASPLQMLQRLSRNLRQLHISNDNHLAALIDAERVMQLGPVQVSDYVLGDRTTPCRAVPGDGAIPLERLIGEIRDAGYEGLFDLELVGPRIEAEGARAATSRAAEYLSELLVKFGA